MSTRAAVLGPYWPQVRRELKDSSIWPGPIPPSGSSTPGPALEVGVLNCQLTAPGNGANVVVSCYVAFLPIDLEAVIRGKGRDFNNQFSASQTGRSSIRQTDAR